ncbi:DNA methyltransferase [Pseudomonas kermanshahensis]|uniref:DNA methyltransferase n=1 Tax=Pseudomonas kermanshahensis TaxID=2745482 RepID=UPI0020932948|nr:DNA methyltransferase [Pseudomonas kermanshahensis]USS55425.1 lactate dehydrogenase [Pseudomonas kermanshahensis]
MNAVEIEQAISDLAEQPFDKAEFPYQFLAAFGHKETALRRLRAGNNNSSDVDGGVLMRNHIHLAVSESGQVGDTLTKLKVSPATLQSKAKIKILMATDGQTLEAEDLTTGETIACAYSNFPDHFGFFLTLAGISTIKEIKDNPIDIRATGRLNKLYVELLRENPEWAKGERRTDMNHFMARLIFCFFAEDTGIFKDGLFTQTIDRMAERDGGNVHLVMSEVFRAMDIKVSDRVGTEPRLPGYVTDFPYVNGALFSGNTEVPRFTRIARTYLMHAGRLNWRKINPDIFGSMIQAVADDEERGALGMHYTNVPNILKVLNPLFLDDLRSQLNLAGDDKRKLLALRRRIARIRVFDPACGSGNFLVIAYKRLRKIESEINELRGERDLRSEIPLTNFRGIELHEFPAEIARLALIIAEFQCDELYRGQREALAEFLPLAKENWIICANALRVDWLELMDAYGTGVKLVADDLFSTPLDQTEIEFVHEHGETYICGNPPYMGATVKAPKGATKEVRERLKREAEARKADLKLVFDKYTNTYGTLDYVSAWFMKAAEYGQYTNSSFAFVATNSVCQGQQVPVLWPLIFGAGHQISFAHTSFKWSNLAAKNAGVTVVIVGLSRRPGKVRKIFTISEGDVHSVKEVENINAYLVPAQNVIVVKRSEPFGDLSIMTKGNAPTDGGNLLLLRNDIGELGLSDQDRTRIVRRFIGSEDSINGDYRYCLWMDKQDAFDISKVECIKQRLAGVAKMRFESDKPATRKLAETPYAFGEIRQRGNELPVVIPRHSSELRDYLPFALGNRGDIVADSASALYDAPLWNVAIFSSRLHLVWIATVCGRIKEDYRYSNTLGWNTFPLPLLTTQNKLDLEVCAKDIILAREAHFPKTIADLYEPDAMPENLRYAHERNDEVLERIYIGRRFRNDTERLEKLFDLYAKVITTSAKAKPAMKAKKAK